MGIWPPYVQQRIKKATQQSGILKTRSASVTSLQFTSEPKAAALATIKDLSKYLLIRTGDTTFIWDASEGTGCLIRYTFKSTVLDTSFLTV
ncbi:hypothetical protein FOXYSP1_03480 [Fusarium oxysporum f. sp. phaseoli]